MDQKIPFNRLLVTSDTMDMLSVSIETGKICGDGVYTKHCCEWLTAKTDCAKALLTTSCTHALELAALLLNIHEGDEVIMPSYTFVSTANAFVLRGAQIVFVDIRPDTMNLDEILLEKAITSKTKAIVPVHYAGVSCEMDAILALADAYGIAVVEDAAQGVMAAYKGRALGAMGTFGCYSFHETKNYNMGEGGALLINRPEYIERAEILREKGTDRSRFLRGQTDKYTWMDIGSSYLPSDLNAAYLYAQLRQADAINEDRLAIWRRYYEGLSPLAAEGKIELPFIPDGCSHNAHMFYIKLSDIHERACLIDFLKEHHIQSVFHYIPLHSAPAGRRFGRFHGQDVYTTRESERLLRLPMFRGLGAEGANRVIQAIDCFFTVS